MENANQFKQKARVLAKASGLRLAEGLGVLLICLLALRLAYPTAVSQRSTHVVANSSDPYAVGDLGGALFMVTRSASGERGCDITTHGHPFDGWDICREIPNPLVTDVLADLVGLLGMPLGYNLGLLLFLASNGLAVYIVVRLTGARGPPALFGAIAASIAPTLFSELEGGFVQHAWWAPAILATGLCVGAIRSWSRFWWIVPGALCLVWSLPVYSMLPFKLLPWTLAAGAVAVFTGEDRKGKLIRAGLGGAIAVGMSLPYAIAALGGDSAGTRVWSGPADYQALHKMMGAMAHSPGDFFSMSFGSPDLIRIPGVVTWVTLIAVAVSYRQFRRWGPALGAAIVLLVISLGPSVGDGPFNDSLPYVWLMDNVEIARGSMRPIRYGVAGLFLLCIACGIALSFCWEKVPRIWMRWMGLLVLCWVLILQVRPKSMTSNLAWPPLSSLESVEGDDAVLDIPLGGQNERRFALWAYHPAPRMNPPHDDQKWKDKIRVPAGRFPLLHLFDQIERGERIDNLEVRLENLRAWIPEVETHGLRHVVIHRKILEPNKVNQWIEIMGQIGGKVVESKDNTIRYALSPNSD